MDSKQQGLSTPDRIRKRSKNAGSCVSNDEMCSRGCDDIRRAVAGAGVGRPMEKIDRSLLLLVSKQRPLHTFRDSLSDRSMFYLLRHRSYPSPNAKHVDAVGSWIGSRHALSSNQRGLLSLFHYIEQTLLAILCRPPAASGYSTRLDWGCSLSFCTSISLSLWPLSVWRIRFRPCATSQSGRRVDEDAD